MLKDMTFIIVGAIVIGLFWAMQVHAAPRLKHTYALPEYAKHQKACDVGFVWDGCECQTDMSTEREPEDPAWPDR